MKNVLHAYGVLASPLQVSQALTQLGISHIVVDGSIRPLYRVKDHAVKQPAMPIILPSLKAFRRCNLNTERQILYVCDSQAALTATNLRIIRPTDFTATIRKSLVYALNNSFAPDWSLTEQVETPESLVAKSTRPSVLNDIQALIYKVNPYDLRKEIQALVISYLAGLTSKKVLIQKLSSSYKLDKMREQINKPQYQVLRDAVAAYRVKGQAEEVAAEYGVESFEILYLVKSSDKQKTI